MVEPPKPLGNNGTGGRCLSSSEAWSLSTMLQVVRSSQSLDVGVGTGTGVGAGVSNRGYPQQQLHMQSSSSSSSFDLQHRRTEAGQRTTHTTTASSASLPLEITGTNSQGGTDATTAMLRQQRHLDAASSPGRTTGGAPPAPAPSSSLSECLHHLLLLGRSQQSNTTGTMSTTTTTTTTTTVFGNINSSPLRPQHLPTLQFTLTSRQTLALYSSFVSTASVYVSDLAAASDTNSSPESAINFDSPSLRGAIMTAWGGIVRMMGGVGTTALTRLLYVGSLI